MCSIHAALSHDDNDDDEYRREHAWTLKHISASQLKENKIELRSRMNAEKNTECINQILPVYIYVIQM